MVLTLYIIESSIIKWINTLTTKHPMKTNIILSIAIGGILFMTLVRVKQVVQAPTVQLPRLPIR
jgi:branched-subunit amino acid transport protein AzlD